MKTTRETERANNLYDVALINADCNGEAYLVERKKKKYNLWYQMTPFYTDRQLHNPIKTSLTKVSIIYLLRESKEFKITEMH